MLPQCHGLTRPSEPGPRDGLTDVCAAVRPETPCPPDPSGARGPRDLDRRRARRRVDGDDAARAGGERGGSSDPRGPRIQGRRGPAPPAREAPGGGLVRPADRELHVAPAPGEGGRDQPVPAEADPVPARPLQARGPREPEGPERTGVPDVPSRDRMAHEDDVRAAGSRPRSLDGATLGRVINTY